MFLVLDDADMMGVTMICTYDGRMTNEGRGRGAATDVQSLRYLVAHKPITVIVDWAFHKKHTGLMTILR